MIGKRSRRLAISHLSLSLSPSLASLSPSLSLSLSASVCKSGGVSWCGVISIARAGPLTSFWRTAVRCNREKERKRGKRKEKRGTRHTRLPRRHDIFHPSPAFARVNLVVSAARARERLLRRVVLHRRRRPRARSRSRSRVASRRPISRIVRSLGLALVDAHAG